MRLLVSLSFPRQTLSMDRTDDMETRQGECRLLPRITEGLQQYDPDEVEEEFKRMEVQTVILSEEEFHRAVYASKCDFVW